MQKQKKPKPNFNTYSDYPFEHVVDDNGKTVYVSYGSWAGSMGAHALGSKIWPDYRIRGMSKPLIQKIKQQFKVK